MSQRPSSPWNDVFEALQHLNTPLPDSDAVDELLPERHREALLGLAERLFAYLEPELLDGHHLPRDGGALVVGNHALLGVDSMALYPLLYRETGRLVRGLGDRSLFRFPALDRAFRHIGVVVGERDNAIDLLKRDELVLVYPGGVDDSFKDPSDHYRLPWRHRTGFIRVAMRAGRPIVPVMAAGIDDAYSFLFRERSISRYLMGGGSARYDFPVSLGLGLMPLPVKFTYQVGEPIMPPEDPALADDEYAVGEFHAQVWATCQALLDETVAVWREEHDSAAVRGRSLLEELLHG